MPLAKASANPPIAQTKPTERHFHGDTYIDEYEWLRDKDSPEVVRYLTAENEYYQQTMAPLEPTIETLIEEFRNRSKENDSSLPVAREKWWYWKATSAGEEYPRYFRCPRSLHPQRPKGSYRLETAPAGTELILDCNKKAAGKEFFSLLDLSISPDEQLAAIGIDSSGDEYYDLEIFEIKTGQVIDHSVQGITGGLIWSQDGKYLYYTTANTAWRSYQVWQHRVPNYDKTTVSSLAEKVGSSLEKTGQTAKDMLIFQENDEQYEVEIDQTSRGDYLLIQSYSSLTSEVNILPLGAWAAAKKGKQSGQTEQNLQHKQGEWGKHETHSKYPEHELKGTTTNNKNGNIKNQIENPTNNYLHPQVTTVFPRKYGLIYGIQSQGDHFIVVHNANNQDFEIASAPVGSSIPTQWQTIYTAKPGERINDVISFQAGLAVSMRAQALETVKILPRIRDKIRSQGEATNPNYPTENTVSYGNIISIEAANLSIIEPYQNHLWETTNLLVQTQSLIQPPTTLEVSLKDGSSQVLHQQEIPSLQTSKYTTWREWATAPDGTKIPITLASRKDITPGDNPGLLYGYGAYEISIDPTYIDHWVSLMDRGFICAIAHIRGGGELGRGWYLDGRELNKHNSFTDFIACADHLIKNGWVNQNRLAASGRSAGGLLMGAVANLGGDRFRAISAHVPFVDALTTILKPELPLTAGEWEEWGNPIIEKTVYKYMKSYSPYENVTNKEYPALMITTSYNDIRVFYVEPTKWVCKLRKLATNGEERPIIYHCEMVAGHAGKTGRYNRWREQAEELAFIVDQTETITPTSR